MGILFFLITIMPTYGISPCNWTSITLNTENPPNSGIIRHYHCLSLTAAGTITVQGRHPLLIYVEGDTNITATINLDGDAGTNGALGSFAGGNGGAGGFAGGGVSNFYDTNGSNGQDGGNGGGGRGGRFGMAPPTADAGGGGGSGGRFGGGYVVAGLSGTSSSTGAGIMPGTGGTGASLNRVSAVFFQGLFAGGTGGGAGGSGENFGNAASGGTGGGGGGGIRLYSKGSIFITGTITANGGNGGNGGWTSSMEGPGGAGGGGSGGAIYLASMEDITVDGGSLVAEGGPAGVGGNTLNIPAGGNGSDGSFGRIRLDDRDGQITIIGAVTIFPQPTVLKFNLTRESDIALGCGGIDKSTPPWNRSLSFLIGLFLVLMAGYFKKIPSNYRLK